MELLDGKPMLDLDISQPLFVDTLGLGSWSSARAPGEVFSFLDILFGKCQEAAVRLGVVKVDNITESFIVGLLGLTYAGQFALLTLSIPSARL